jgi:hypothetical protein
MKNSKILRESFDQDFNIVKRHYKESWIKYTGLTTFYIHLNKPGLREFALWEYCSGRRMFQSPRVVAEYNFLAAGIVPVEIPQIVQDYEITPGTLAAL